MKAHKLFQALVTIEDAAKIKNKIELTVSIPRAVGAFYQLVDPLKENLERIKASIKVA